MKTLVIGGTGTVGTRVPARSRRSVLISTCLAVGGAAHLWARPAEIQASEIIRKQLTPFLQMPILLRSSLKNTQLVVFKCEKCLR